MDQGFKLDLHVHCRQGHPEALVEAHELVIEAQKCALDGLVFCPLASPDKLRLALGDNPDSQTVVAYLRRGYDAGCAQSLQLRESGASSAPRVFFGLQYRIPRTADDVLIMGIDPEALLGVDLLNVDPWDLRRYVVDRGGLLIASHPFRQRSHGAPFGGGNMFDAVEVWNGRRGEKNRNDLAAAWCQKIDALAVAGSGARRLEELGEAVIELAEMPQTNTELGSVLRRRPPLRILRRHDLHLGLQSCRFNGLMIEDELRHADRQGLEAFEIFFDDFVPDDVDAKARQRFRDMARSMGLEMSVLAPLQPVEVSNARQSCQALRDFCADVGAELLVIPALSILHDPSLVASCALRALSSGLRLAISNGPDPEGRVSPEDLLNLLRHVPGSQAALDLGGAHLHSDALHYSKTLLKGLHETGRKLVHLQLHDNDGEQDLHLSMGEGNLPFAESLRLIFAAGFDGLGIVEHWRDVRSEATQINALVRKMERPWRGFVPLEQAS